MPEKEHTIENFKYNLLTYLKNGEKKIVYDYLTNYNTSISLKTISEHFNGMISQRLIHGGNGDWLVENGSSKLSLEATIMDNGLTYLNDIDRQERQDKIIADQATSTLLTDTSVRSTNKTVKASIYITGFAIIGTFIFQGMTWYVAKQEYEIHKEERDSLIQKMKRETLPLFYPKVKDIPNPKPLDSTQPKKKI